MFLMHFLISPFYYLQKAKYEINIKYIIVNIVPFIIEDDLKMFYYRGLKEWDNEKGYLTDTCLTAQDRYKAYLDYFRIDY